MRLQARAELQRTLEEERANNAAEKQRLQSATAAAENLAQQSTGQVSETAAAGAHRVRGALGHATRALWQVHVCFSPRTNPSVFVNTTFQICGICGWQQTVHNMNICTCVDHVEREREGERERGSSDCTPVLCCARSWLPRAVR